MDWAQHYATGAGFRFWPNEELVRFVGDRQFGSVLEAGCGGGGNLWFLAEHATQVVGVDNCHEALSEARKHMTRRGTNDVKLVATDVRDLSTFADGNFDFLVDCMTSQHLPWAEHPALYAEYRRVLKPGGRLWLYHLDCKTVSTRGEWKGWRGWCDWAWLALFPGIDFFCLPILTQLSDVVEAAGFRMPTVRGLAREYPDGQCAHYSIIEAEAV